MTKPTRKPLEIEDWPDPSVFAIRSDAIGHAELIVKSGERELHIPIRPDRQLAMARELIDILWKAGFAAPP